jgi:hypothetical protein
VRNVAQYDHGVDAMLGDRMGIGGSSPLSERGFRC